MWAHRAVSGGLGDNTGSIEGIRVGAVMASFAVASFGAGGLVGNGWREVGVSSRPERRPSHTL